MAQSGKHICHLAGSKGREMREAGSKRRIDASEIASVALYALLSILGCALRLPRYGGEAIHFNIGV